MKRLTITNAKYHKAMDILSRAKSVSYNTRMVKENYESNDPQLEKYNKDKDYEYIYTDGEMLKNSIRRINYLLNKYHTEKESKEWIEYHILNDKVFKINNFTVIA